MTHMSPDQIARLAKNAALKLGTRDRYVAAAAKATAEADRLICRQSTRELDSDLARAAQLRTEADRLTRLADVVDRELADLPAEVLELAARFAATAAELRAAAKAAR